MSDNPLLPIHLSRRPRATPRVIDLPADPSTPAAERKPLTIPKIPVNAITILGTLVVIGLVVVVVFQPRNRSSAWDAEHPTAAIVATAPVQNPAIMPTALPVATPAAASIPAGEFLFFAPEGDPAEQLASPVAYTPVARYGPDWVQVTIPGREQALWVRSSAVQVENVLALQDLKPAPTAVPVIVERQVVVVPAAPAPAPAPTSVPVPTSQPCPVGTVAIPGSCIVRSGT